MKVKSESEVAQLYLTLSDPMDFSLPGSSVHGNFQARVLEWGAIAFSDSSNNLREKERYKHLNAEFQRMARRDKKAFLSDQCKEIEENNRMRKTREKAMAPHSSTLAWKIPWTEEPGRLKSMGSLRDRKSVV